MRVFVASSAPLSPAVDAATSRQTVSPVSVDRARSSDAWTFTRIALAIWLAGMALLFVRVAGGLAMVWWIARRAQPMTDPDWIAALERSRRQLLIDSPVRLLRSERGAMPFTCGLVHPVVVLPATADSWSASRREAVLLHELAHVQRRDLFTNLVAQAACAFYWFHPLVWTAARRLRAESERACDDLVLHAGTRASEYADHLLEIVRAAGRSRTPAVALAMAKRSDFEGRVIAILEPGVKRQGLSALKVAFLTLFFALSAIPLAAVGMASPEAGPLDESQSSSLGGALVDEPLEDQGERDLPQAAPTKDSAASDADLEPTTDESAAEETPIDPRLAQQTSNALVALAATLTDANAEVRLAAAQALGELDDPRAIEALSQALRTDADPRVRETAAWALGEIESPTAVPALIAALRAEKVATVRDRIVRALGEIEDARAVDAIGDALRDESVAVRRTAIWALGEIESADAVPALMPFLKDDDVEVRKQAAWALGEIESPNAVDALSAAIRDADVNVREMVVWALGEIESGRAAPALAAAMKDEQPVVRRKAAWALGEIDDLRSAPPALIEALRDSDREVRETAAHAVGELGDVAAVPGLIVLARDPDLKLRRTAVWALAEIGGPEAIEAIVGLLKDEDPEIRKMAAEALGKNR